MKKWTPSWAPRNSERGNMNAGLFKIKRPAFLISFSFAQNRADYYNKEKFLLEERNERHIYTFKSAFKICLRAL